MVMGFQVPQKVQKFSPYECHETEVRMGAYNASLYNRQKICQDK
jgi:hypothetical protein